MDDLELLRQYSKEGSQPAFSALVARHVDMVYSAARRQVWSSELAEEVTQAVFLDLARSAGKLRADSHVGSWLYVVARRTSVDAIRRESRRQKREQAGMEGAALRSPSSDWSSVEPLLDEAITSLGDSDRRAVLLRFFEKRNFNEISQILGTSEEAAQKRVRRAINRLRQFLAQRGVAASTVVLAAEIAPRAVQAAPVGLAASVSSAIALAHPALQQAAIFQSAHTLAMTFTQKAAVTTILAVAIAGGLYQNSIIRRQAREVAILEKQVEGGREQIRQLNRARGNIANELAASRQATDQLKNDANQAANDPTADAMKSWLVRVGQLRQQMETRPGQKIPELKFVTDEDWFNATKTKLETDGDYRRALASVRSAGENKFMWQIQSAVNKYAQANAGQFPAAISQLQPFFDSQDDVGMLQRFVVAPASAIPNVGMGGDQIITQKIQIDAQYDTNFVLGPHGYGTYTPSPKVGAPLQSLIEAYSGANGGQPPSDPAQLVPFAVTPDQQVALQKAMLRSGVK